MDGDEAYPENVPLNTLNIHGMRKNSSQQGKFTKRGIFAFYKQLDGNLSSYVIVGPLG
jgi:hypothetical protein